MALQPAELKEKLKGKKKKIRCVFHVHFMEEGGTRVPGLCHFPRATPVQHGYGY